MKRMTLHDRRSALIVLLLLLAGLFAVQSTLAGDDPPPQTPAATPTALLPNTPVPAQLSQRAIAGGDTLLNDQLVSEPFPATEPDEATIKAVVDDYLKRGQAEIGVPSQASVWPESIPSAVSPINLPLVQRPISEIVRPPVVTPTPDDRHPADVAVALWAEPSIRVARNGTLTYELRVRNYGRGAALRTEVEIPFSRSQIVPIGSQLNSGAGDWVSELNDSSLTVTFGEVGKGEERSGKIIFRVAGGLADNTVIGTRASYHWHDEVRSASGATNWAPVLIGGGNDTAAYVWLIVEPANGDASTTRGFYSDRFLPKEGVTTWLNVPGGTTRALSVRGTANSVGQVWLSYKPADLTPGTYQLVVYGNRSKLIGVVSFTVR